MAPGTEIANPQPGEFGFWVMVADEPPNRESAYQMATDEGARVQEENTAIAGELWLFVVAPSRLKAGVYLARLLGHKIPTSEQESEYLLTYLGY